MDGARRLSRTLLAASAALVPLMAAAADDGYARSPSPSYTISAPVVNVTPIHSTRTIEHPVRQCTSTSTSRVRHDGYHDGYERRRSEENHFRPGLFGGIVGGLIGNQFGGGSGKKALTVIGALAGSSIARDQARQRSRNRSSSYDHSTPRVCKTTYDTEVVESISAYDVTYEYDGQLFSKRMNEHPGERVRVRVEIEPTDD